MFSDKHLRKAILASYLSPFYHQGVDVSELARLVVKKAGEGQVIFVPGVTVLRSLVYTGSHFQYVSLTVCNEF